MEETRRSTSVRLEQAGIFLVGSGSDNQFVVEDRFLEPVHLVIVKKSGDYRARLSGGIQGTFTFNGQSVTEAILKTGDRIEVGRSILVVKTDPEFFLDIQTFGQERISARWIITLLLVAVLTVGGVLFWPRILPTIAAAQYLEQGNKLFEEGKTDKARISYQSVLKLLPGHAEGSYRLGLVMEKKGQFAPAFDLFLTTVRNDPVHMNGLVRVGRYLFRGGQMDQAMEMANRILALDPKHREGGIMQAVILARQGKEHEAIDASDKLITGDPKWSEAVIFLAALHEKQGNSDKAIKTYQEGLKSQPGDLALTIRLANLYERIKTPAKGEIIFRGLVTAKPDNLIRWVWLTNHYSRTNRPPMAIQTMEEAIRTNPKNHGLRLMLATLYRKENNARKAIALYQDIIIASEFSLEGMKAHIGFAEVLLGQGKLKRASGLYRDVTNWEDKTPMASVIRAQGWLALGRIATSQKRFKEAVPAFQAAVSEQPKSIIALNLLANSLLLTEETDAAKKYLHKAVGINAKHPQTQMLLANIAAHEGRLEDAERGFHAVLNILPNHLFALSVLSFIQGKQGHWAAALETAEKTRLVYPKQPIGLFLAGNAYFNLKRYAESINVLEEALNQSPDDFKTLSLLAMSYLAINQPKKVLPSIIKAIGEKPDDPAIQNLLGEVCVADKAFHEAQTAFEKAIRLKQEWVQPRLNLARLYLIQKKTKEATVTLEQAATAIPKHPDPVFMLATINAQNGNVQAANAGYAKTLELNPKNNIAANNLASGVSI